MEDLPAANQSLWPTQIGFDKFYGFFGGETDQFQPVLIDGNTRIKTPRKENYHFTTDMTDQTIQWLNMQHSYNADKPFFAYYAPGAAHAPHQGQKNGLISLKASSQWGGISFVRRLLKDKRLQALFQKTPSYRQCQSVCLAGIL
ncbi:sulfatase-like hydrolase/transferase (plasmid) [Vibrio alginolyticus]